MEKGGRLQSRGRDGQKTEEVRNLSGEIKKSLIFLRKFCVILRSVICRQDILVNNAARING